jgi:hypothetical protein
MPDVNELARKVQDAWDAEFSAPMNREFDYRQARIAVETVLAEAFPEGILTDTQWGVRYSGLRGVLEYAPYDDEEDARDHTLGISPPLTATVISRRRWWTRWTEAPETKDGSDG